MEQNEQEEKTDRLVCHDCGCIIDPDKDSYFNTGEGYIVCSDCYESDYFTCSRCGGVHNVKHSYDVEGGDVLCENCADAHTVVCRDCGCRVYDEDAYCYSNGEYLCSDCYERGYFTCERCDEVCDEELMRHVGGRCLCESCAEEERHEHGVMGYHGFGAEYHPVKVDGEKVPKDEPFIGVELECDEGDFSPRPFDEWMDDDYLVHFESDGSLSDDGVELITQPCSLRFHQKLMRWKSLCENLKDQGFVSHNCSESECGLHVHMTRNRIPVTSILKMDVWLNRWRMFREIARRDSIYNGEYDRSKRMDIGHAIYNDSTRASEKVYDKFYGTGFNERYQPLNTHNSRTIEIRIFRGTLNHETVLGTIEVCHALAMFAGTVGIAMTYDTGPADFLGYVARNMSRYPNVFPMLKRLLRPGEPTAVMDIVTDVNNRIEKKNKKQEYVKCA